MRKPQIGPINAVTPTPLTERVSWIVRLRAAFCRRWIDVQLDGVFILGPHGGGHIVIRSDTDAKAVAAIEKLTGGAIPYMQDAALPAPASVQPEPVKAAQRQGASGPRRSRNDAQRQTHRSSASVARIPQRPPQPAKPRNDEGDISHLPAFLLRPVPLKA